MRAINLSAFTETLPSITSNADANAVRGSTAALTIPHKAGMVLGMVTSQDVIPQKSLERGDEVSALTARTILQNYYDNQLTRVPSDPLTDKYVALNALMTLSMATNEAWGSRENTSRRSVQVALLHARPHKPKNRLVGYAVHAAGVGIQGIWGLHPARTRESLEPYLEADEDTQAKPNAIGVGLGLKIQEADFLMTPGSRALVALGESAVCEAGNRASPSEQIEEHLRTGSDPETVVALLKRLGTAGAYGLMVIDCRHTPRATGPK